MGVLYNRMIERHGQDKCQFVQVDFSATPFYGSGQSKEYFPHIVYDFDLRHALNKMLVKQLFLEERQVPPGKYRLIAFCDNNGNRKRDEEEDAVSFGLVEVTPGDTRELGEWTGPRCVP